MPVVYPRGLPCHTVEEVDVRTESALGPQWPCSDKNRIGMHATCGHVCVRGVVVHVIVFAWCGGACDECLCGVVVHVMCEEGARCMCLCGCVKASITHPTRLPTRNLLQSSSLSIVASNA